MTHPHSPPARDAERRGKAEEAVRKEVLPAEETLEVLAPEKVRQIIHELRVHQIELEMQNEELRQKQGELDSLRARYFDLYNLAPVGYCTVNQQGLILEANLTAADLLGVGRKDLSRQPFNRFISGESQDTHYLRCRRLFETGEPQTYTLHMNRPDGKTFWAHLATTTAQNTHEERVFRFTLSDISERQQAEEALRESEEKYRAIFDNAGDAVFIHTAEARILAANQRACERYGYQQSELRAMTVAQIDSPAEAPKAPDRIARLLQVGVLAFETVHQRKDGSLIPTEVISRRIIWNGKPAMISICRDITERKRLQDVQLFLAQTSSGKTDLSFFHTLARFLAEQLRMDFICIDRLEGDGLKARTVAVWCDGHFEDNVTYALQDTPCGDVVGKSVCCFPARVCQLFPRDQVLKDLRAESYAGVTLWSHTGTPIGLIAVISRQALDNRPLVETTLKLVAVRAAGELERLDAEEAGARFEAQLQQAQKLESVGRLAGGVAHDFNNMLGVILGNTDIALDGLEGTHPLHDNLLQIKTAAEHSAKLTGQLLAFARKQTVTPRVLDLNDTVGSMLLMLHRLIGEDVELSWQPAVDLWPIRMDPSQIDQILVNLCVNARDALTGVGRITIGTRNRLFDEAFCAAHPTYVPGEFVCLSVSDNGCGMDEETLAQIFEPFFTTKEVGKGTGLGLATVYGAITQNGGFICVDSRPGSGATFSLFLPRHAGQLEPAPAIRPSRPDAQRQATILLVEDESTLLHLTALMLKRQGFTVLAADTPGKALQLAHEHAGEIDLLLTDIIMPGMNGRDLANNLLAHFPNLRCIFMSGYPADIIAQKGALKEHIHFLQKPFSRDDVSNLIAAALRKNHG